MRSQPPEIPMPTHEVRYEYRMFIFHPHRLNPSDIIAMREQGWTRIREVVVKNPDGTITLYYEREIKVQGG
jgi:hypothetical protein